jgi:hypothetical protein
MSIRDDYPLVYGAASGAVAYLVGYVLTYALTISEVQDSFITELSGALSDSQTAWQVVGWVFYNAHSVTTKLVVDVPIFGGTSATNFITESDAISPILYVIPVGLLLVSGLAVARLHGVEELGDAVRAGPTVALAYAPLAVLGVFLFRVTADGSWGGPTIITGVALAGVIYPVVFGTLGAALATVLDR